MHHLFNCYHSKNRSLVHTLSHGSEWYKMLSKRYVLCIALHNKLRGLSIDFSTAGVSILSHSKMSQFEGCQDNARTLYWPLFYLWDLYFLNKTNWDIRVISSSSATLCSLLDSVLFQRQGHATFSQFKPGITFPTPHVIY